MNKTYKKSDIDKYVGAIKNEHVVREEDLNELVDTAGTIVDRNDNYVATPSLIKSKKTSDDFARSAAQGPEAYFIYGGPYYGVNYSYVVNEEEILDEEISPEAVQDLEAFHDIDLYSEGEMKDLVDEIFLKKKDKQKGIVKRANEQGVLGDINTHIPDISELKKMYEKPMVIRKLNHLLDLIGKEELTGEELAIVLNHLIENIDLTLLNDKFREIIGDKIKYEIEDDE